jgi:hypothetical protein
MPVRISPPPRSLIQPGYFSQDQVGQDGGADGLAQSGHGDHRCRQVAEGPVEGGVSDELGEDGHQAHPDVSHGRVAEQGETGGGDDQEADHSRRPVDEGDIDREGEAAAHAAPDHEIAGHHNRSRQGQEVADQGSAPSQFAAEGRSRAGVAQAHHPAPNQGQQDPQGRAKGDGLPKEEGGRNRHKHRGEADQHHRAGHRRVFQGGDPGHEMQGQEDPGEQHPEQIAAADPLPFVPVAPDGHGQDQQGGQGQAIGGDDQGGGLALGEADEDRGHGNRQDAQGQDQIGRNGGSLPMRHHDPSRKGLSSRRACPKIVGQLQAVVLQGGQARQNRDTPGPIPGSPLASSSGGGASIPPSPPQPG